LVVTRIHVSAYLPYRECCAAGEKEIVEPIA